ncbi:capsular biosynthesis protein [Acidihalobacter aeolianus]|uniref:Capsular biosynthesis protein n=1 Tax=Acidihalobacter aeolianus TaxID=2792603 RepID=A0A1D8KC75_9GAMM|nr:capsular biosynthesis protein [Acidihalobacter aeolianus]
MEGLEATARLHEFPERLYAWSFPRWKWRFVRRCFPGRQVTFVEPGARLSQPAGLLLWGSAERPDGMPKEMPVVRMEDGFLRSVGLGAELTRPLSWVVDTRGMYYDASQPSDLEWLLQHAEFTPTCRARAAALREAVAAGGVTKYNVGQGEWARPADVPRVILVPGQVESDASIARGGAAVRGNMALLQAVRAANPDAFLVYKPHPDVEARLRILGAQEDEAERWCDACVSDVPMERMLAQVDEVHTMTSLSGFEALLRGLRVVCYGHPFYAGWGLTEDKVPLPRRSRRLALDELVAGALILYPLYLDIAGRGLSTPEGTLQALQAWKSRQQGRVPWWRGAYRAILRRAIGVR